MHLLSGVLRIDGADFPAPFLLHMRHGRVDFWQEEEQQVEPHQRRTVEREIPGVGHGN